MKETDIDPEIIEYVFEKYRFPLSRIHKIMIKVGNILISKKIRPAPFIAKYLGYEKFNFKRGEEEYLAHLIRKHFGEIRERKLLSDKETCVVIAENSKA